MGKPLGNPSADRQANRRTRCDGVSGRAAGVKATFFAQPTQFREWLREHHATASELLVGFYKRDSGKPSISWPESVDQALAFGWIDGVRKRIDDESYTIRFTPRRASSIWSAVNIKRVGELDALGLMEPAGLAAFERRSGAKSAIYAYEQDGTAQLSADHQRVLDAHPAARRFFDAQAPWYRRRAIHRVVSAKKELTQRKRLDSMIALWAAGRKE
jgi:uncharacterized protein YdeI (YjbR/CyaY-like superfamily)